MALSCAFGSTRRPRRFRFSWRWVSRKASEGAAGDQEHARGERDGWRALLDDPVKRALKTPELVSRAQPKGSTACPASRKLFPRSGATCRVQRWTVPKHRNLLPSADDSTKLRLAKPLVSSAHAPNRLHEEVSADYNDMIYADSKSEIAAKRTAFVRKWWLKCRAVADRLKEAREKLFTFCAQCR